MSGGLQRKHGRKRNTCPYGGVAGKSSRREFSGTVNQKDEAPDGSFDLREALHAFL
jgi:hypothetical protein